MPDWRKPDPVLEEKRMAEGLRLLLWRILTDLRLWVDGGLQPRLFTPGPDLLEILDAAPDELRAAVDLLAPLWHAGTLRPEEALRACGDVWHWAEARNHYEVALQFAEAAARTAPEIPGYARIAGNLSRHRGEAHRAGRWLRRALRQARLRKEEVEYVQARLGLESVEADLGNLHAAIHHATKAFRAALRNGQRRLAGWAYHDLLLLKIGLERYDEAWAHALDALSAYKRDHPRIPALAHDIALLMSRIGHFSAAMSVFEKTLPFMTRGHERMIVLSNLCRAAAACGDRMRYERTMREVWTARDAGTTIPASAWVHLAHAAHTAHDWPRADELIRVSLERSHTGYVEMSRRLAAQVESRAGGDVDVLPEPGSEIETVRDLLLEKLRKHTVPGWGPGTVPPDRYPDD